MAEQPIERTPEEIAALVAKSHAEAVKLQYEAAWYEQQARREAAAAEGAEIDLRAKRRSAHLEDAKDQYNRLLDFTSQVSSQSVDEAVKILAQWARLSDEPIVLRIHSPGGSVLDGLRLYDYVRTLVADGIKVTTVTLGVAASMAGILLQAGSERVMAPESWILCHEVSGGAIGKIGELDDTVEWAKALNQRLFGLLTARAKVSKATLLKRVRRKDLWIPAEEAVEKLGLADRLGYR